MNFKYFHFNGNRTNNLILSISNLYNQLNFISFLLIKKKYFDKFLNSIIKSLLKSFVTNKLESSKIIFLLSNSGSSKNYIKL